MIDTSHSQLTGGQWKKNPSNRAIFSRQDQRSWASRIDGAGGHIGTSDSWWGTQKNTEYVFGGFGGKGYEKYID